MTPEEREIQDEQLYLKEVDLCVPSWNFPAPYDQLFFDLCQQIESDPNHGLNNGATALYWHMVATAHCHWGKRKVKAG